MYADLRRLRGYYDRRDWRILAVVVATAFCCASVLTSTPIDISPYARSIVSPKPVAATAPLILDAGTPESALTSWFKAVQTTDVPAVLRLTTAHAQRSVGRTALSSAIRVVGGALGQPSIVQVENDGRRAKVRLLVLGYLRAGSQPVSEVPLLVPLVRSPHGWQINDVSYLMSSARAIRSLPRAGA
jgi:hypothetical protein